MFQWRPSPSVPTTEAFVRESRITPVEADIMGVRGIFHEGRVMELVNNFPKWREERLPGVRAFQSTYDRYVTILCCHFRSYLLSFEQSWCSSVQVAFPDGS